MMAVLCGILGCVFGVLGILTSVMVFVPLSILCAIVGAASGITGRSFTGVFASVVAGVLSIVGVVVSPPLWLLFSGLFLAVQRETPDSGIALSIGHSASLPVYPAFAEALKPVSLPDLIFMALPETGKDMSWDQMLDAPVKWTTKGIDFLNNGGSERVGLARVRVNGSMSTILRESREELAWTITFSTARPAKFGPEQIKIEPGVLPNDGCFGTLFDGCTFSAAQAITSTKFKASLECAPSYGKSGQTFKITTPGRQPTLLLYIYDSGSGGEQNYVELHPLADEPVLCATYAVRPWDRPEATTAATPPPTTR